MITQFYRLLTMAYYTQDYSFSVICPSSGIPEVTGKWIDFRKQIQFPKGCVTFNSRNEAILSAVPVFVVTL
jgi:hypothetical protein